MEHWTDKTLESVKGMQRALPPEDAFGKIQARLDKPSVQLESVEKRPMMAAAAAIALLISCNLYVVADYFSTNAQAQTETQYEGIISDYNLYAE
ncbi:hypothetical protein LV84_00161 [Algoriphagus ratkowskyi]|uniref:Uncharacterized protein n=1 Tax=Algoriphagus ratkowskyi TaxID=57028 RepID=A0A2W7RK19_9BACT|nr:hypothetical protein [Algoriphagus ratkowskyi]PZX61173.1 hypothetical protein LV84_00161 [Algoriphagus ratkowskyi]TXD79297.1 hypothetical protein ESW18_03435 [Algoriphagus ratkowskyi]